MLFFAVEMFVTVMFNCAKLVCTALPKQTARLLDNTRPMLVLQPKSLAHCLPFTKEHSFILPL